MRLRPFFSYYGSKYTIIEKYPYPEHETIIEPFAGSAQYATRYPHKKVHLYDLDENIVQVWDYLINVSESEILSLDMDFDHIDDSRLTSTQKKRVGFWIAYARAYPANTNGHLKKIDWRVRVSSQLQYIRHWKVHLSSYEQIDNECATWFIDPPYIDKGKHYRRSSKNIDFDHLGAWCKDRKGHYIVCENAGADWLPFESLTTFKSNTNEKTEEAIFTNIQDKQLSLF